jgi:hypothetical protein
MTGDVDSSEVLEQVAASLRTCRGGSVTSGALNEVSRHLGQAPRGHSSTLDVTLSAKGMASPHSSIIVSHRIWSNFLNGSLFL